MVESLIPSFIDLCDASLGDRTSRASEFYRALPERLDALVEAAGLESIVARKGAAHDPNRYAVLKLVPTDNPDLRDTVAAFHSRGYARDGRILRKASVALYR
jgi:molecular chaperone GrpE (heat shock protein)